MKPPQNTISQRYPIERQAMQSWAGWSHRILRRLCSPFDKAFQITPRSHTQHKLPARICHNRKLLFPTAIHASTKELLELFQWRFCSDNLIPSTASLELGHGFFNWITVLDLAFFE